MGIPIDFQKSSVHETLTGSELEFVSVFLLPHPTKSQSKIVSSVQGGQSPRASRGAQHQQNRHTQRTAPDTIWRPSLWPLNLHQKKRLALIPALDIFPHQ